jgi:hypothetical protein
MNNREGLILTTEVILLKKDKHVLPDTSDTFSARVKRGAKKKRDGVATIYGPDNEPLTTVDMKVEPD